MLLGINSKGISTLVVVSGFKFFIVHIADAFEEQQRKDQKTGTVFYICMDLLIPAFER
jgi:hypothetical protein